MFGEFIDYHSLNILQATTLVRIVKIFFVGGALNHFESEGSYS